VKKANTLASGVSVVNGTAFSDPPSLAPDTAQIRPP
jgi:hypothetical protein